MTKLAERACERILAIQWNEELREGRSSVRLLFEYFRRAALWSDYLQGGSWPFFDIPFAVDPSVRADAELIRRADEHVPKLAEPRVRDACFWSIHFAEIEGREVDLPNLLPPYEPLIVMFERGFDFYIGATGLIDVGAYSVRWPHNMTHHLSTTPRVPMSQVELDEIDSSEN